MNLAKHVQGQHTKIEQYFYILAMKNGKSEIKKYASVSNSIQNHKIFTYNFDKISAFENYKA